jgi:hypothetical protein
MTPEKLNVKGRNLLPKAPVIVNNPQEASVKFADIMKVIEEDMVGKFEAKTDYAMHVFGMELVKATPKDTGAAAGVAAFRDMYPSHPAAKMGLEIGPGFSLEDGDNYSGWRLVKKKTRQGFVYYFANRMWDKYLKYIEYGFYPSQHQGFVKIAFEKFKATI